MHEAHVVGVPCVLSAWSSIHSCLLRMGQQVATLLFVAGQPWQVLSPPKDGTPGLTPGQWEWSLVSESEAAITTGQW
jgi:hypothetical protein